MKIDFQVLVDQTKVRDALESLEFVGGNSSDALRVAINKTMPKVKTMSSRAIRDQVRLTASYVNGRLTIRKATRENLNGSIGTPSRGLLLSRYSTDSALSESSGNTSVPRVPRLGIRVKIRPNGAAKSVVGGPDTYPNKPFYILLNKGRAGGGQLAIAARLTGARKPLKVFNGPSLSQVFSTVRGDVLERASAEYEFQVLDAVRYLLTKTRPPG